MRCLILGKVWPEPSSTAAGQRICDLISALSVAGWELSFASAAQAGEYAVDLAIYGVASHAISVNDPAFDAWVAELEPDVVVFDRFMTEEQFGWRVAEHCPEALRVLDTSDLHCLRLARQAQMESGGVLQLKNETAIREVAAIYRSDLTLMISEFEIELLRREFSIPETLLAYWPFPISLPDAFPGFAARQNFIMIGSLQHAPNLDAARWCQQAIWPQIRSALPEAELHCFGSYGAKYAGELNQPDRGFHFKGRAGNALQTMSGYRVNLAPLRFGAGLKGKVFDGFLSGTPTVMTPIAAEGIFVESHWAHESIDAFVDEAVALYTDPARWQSRQGEGQAVCRERFAASRWRQQLPERLRLAHDQRARHREANFVGQMLRHHQHRSTEFLSRWIEAKNKLKGSV
ncbi:MAG: glycosyltransferase [Puniceicoccaceae bacterium]|nr:MAG: glycosyltransferase [Puniceicoccaceae bacterium]